MVTESLSHPLSFLFLPLFTASFFYFTRVANALYVFLTQAFIHAVIIPEAIHIQHLISTVYKYRPRGV